MDSGGLDLADSRAFQVQWEWNYAAFDLGGGDSIAQKVVGKNQ